MNVNYQMHVDLVLPVQTLRAVIAATVLKVLMVMPDLPKVVSIWTNVLGPLVAVMHSAQTQTEASNASVQKVEMEIQWIHVEVNKQFYL